MSIIFGGIWTCRKAMIRVDLEPPLFDPSVHHIGGYEPAEVGESNSLQDEYLPATPNSNSLQDLISAMDDQMSQQDFPPPPTEMELTTFHTNQLAAIPEESEQEERA